MISREVMRSFLEEDLLEKHPESSCADSAIGFSISYQLERLNCKENQGFVSERHKEEAFLNFKKIQSELKDFNDNFETLNALYAEEFERAATFCHMALPPVEHVWEEIWEGCTFGPGAFNGYDSTFGNTGYSTHYKIGGQQTVTPQAKSLALQVINDFFPHWKLSLVAHYVMLETIPGNRLAYVPKDVRKCRPIAIEPSLNVFLQQGVGRFLGSYLRKKGIADIFDGQNVQRIKAKDLRNGTIDLSNASDTISLKLVERLLPADWYELLMAVRSPSWSYGSESGVYENISSQGNAFTFPLETLIFKAVASSFTGIDPGLCTVYGDDIIVPAHFAPRAVESLELCGFTVNQEKSYYGQHDNERRFFRESCGADFFKGHYVTPVYYRENARTYSDIAVLYNRLYERWGFLPRCHNYLLSLIPSSERIWGPQWFVTDRSDYSDLYGSVAVPLRNSNNRAVCIYNGWLWRNEIHDFPDTGKEWTTRGRKIPKKHKLNEYSSYLAFLLGADDIVPRFSRPAVRKGLRIELPGFCLSLIEKKAYEERPF